MFNERSPRGGEQDKSPEQLNLEKQKKKLTRFFAHDGDMRYVFGPYDDRLKEQFSGDKLTPEEAAKTQEMLLEDKGVESMERNLLENMQSPVDKYGADKVFEGMAGDKHQKRILGHMTGMKWGTHDYTSGRNVAEFLQQYPTPMDFEEKADDFLQIILDHNGEQKHQEYAGAMEEFQLRVYGKRYEYHKAMKELHKEAAEKKAESGRERAKNGKFGKRWFEIFNKGELVKDSGLATKNKNLTDPKLWAKNPNRPNEDAAYYNPKMAIFGVFDGAGGMPGAALASQLAKDTMIREVDERAPETAYELGQILMEANEATVGKGYSTAVIGRILEARGRKALIYASVGDSRIYVVRNGQAMPLTKDEGYGNRITNALGIKDCQVKQAGEFPLKKGDRVVFCSDGVTGDYESYGDKEGDIMQDDELARIVGGAINTDVAAQELVDKARKTDDRTAIVVEV